MSDQTQLEINDDELLSGPDNEFFSLLVELARRGKLDERAGCAAYSQYLKQALPSDDCEDIEEWKQAATRMTGAVFRRSLHAAQLISEKGTERKTVAAEFLEAAIPLMREELVDLGTGFFKAGVADAASAAGKKARQAREDKREPVREFARQAARQYCISLSKKPSRSQCVKAIVGTVIAEANRMQKRFAGDEIATRNTIDGWLGAMPDAKTLFKPHRK